jgi:hypothetical protein
MEGKMRKAFAAVAIPLVVAVALLVPRAAAQSSGTWAIHPGDTAGQVQLRLEARKDDHGNFEFSHRVAISELRGLTASQMASPSGVNVHFQIAREAGAFACDGYFKQNEGAGTFVFRADPRFVPAMHALGITDIDQQGQMSMALMDVTTDWTRQMKAAGVNVDTGKQLIEMRIFDVTPEYVRDLRALGYSVTEPRELTRFRIFHVTPDSIRSLQSAGYHPDAEELVKMSIFKVTPEFIGQVKQLGYTNVPVEDLVKMRIFKVTPDYIREMRSRGLKDLTIEKLVKLRIAGID